MGERKRHLKKINKNSNANSNAIGHRAIVLENPTPTLADYSVSLARTVILQHENGDFSVSGVLADMLGRDSSIMQSLNQRILGAIGLPFKFEPSPSDSNSSVVETFLSLRKRYPMHQAEFEMLRWVVLMGFCIAQKVQVLQDDGTYALMIDVWHPSNCRYDKNLNQWFVQTTTGEICIQRDDQWIIYTPFSEKYAYMYGVVRCLLLSYRRAEDSYRDAARRSEVAGQAVWLAKIPSSQRKTDEIDKFTRALKNIGRNAVIPLPQGNDQRTSYDVSLVEYNGRGWEMFDFLIKTHKSDVRLAILGQNLTSENGSVGTLASAKVGDTVRQDYKEWDVLTLDECFYSQFYRQWCVYLFGNADLTPTPTHDARTPEQQKMRAEQIKSTAESCAAWLALGVEVDVVTEAKLCGVKVL